MLLFSGNCDFDFIKVMKYFIPRLLSLYRKVCYMSWEAVS